LYRPAPSELGKHNLSQLPTLLTCQLKTDRMLTAYRPAGAASQSRAPFRIAASLKRSPSAVPRRLLFSSPSFWRQKYEEEEAFCRTVTMSMVLCEYTIAYVFPSHDHLYMASFIA